MNALISSFFFALMPAMPLMIPTGGASPGNAAPPFSLADQNGKMVRLDDFKEQTVVLEWVNPDCPFVVRHYKASTFVNLFEKFKGEIVWLAINSTHSAGAADNQEWIEKHKIPYPILLDSDGAVGRSYGAQTTPQMVVIHKGVVVYLGAIDDDPRGKGAQVNYVEQALNELRAGKPVSVPQTKPYGCSVKYGS
jgi:peroxiredoxin